jgi:hypothetical protein
MEMTGANDYTQFASAMPYLYLLQRRSRRLGKLSEQGMLKLSHRHGSRSTKSIVGH